MVNLKNFIIKLADRGADQYWMSGTDAFSNAQWIWQTLEGPGIPLKERGGYYNWHSGYPRLRKKTENCLYLEVPKKGSIVWKAASCNKEKRFLCTLYID